MPPLKVRVELLDKSSLGGEEVAGSLFVPLNLLENKRMVGSTRSLFCEQ